jgi:effector-binding domain-containing protein
MKRQYEDQQIKIKTKPNKKLILTIIYRIILHEVSVAYKL